MAQQLGINHTYDPGDSTLIIPVLNQPKGSGLFAVQFQSFSFIGFCFFAETFVAGIKLLLVFLGVVLFIDFHFSHVYSVLFCSRT